MRTLARLLTFILCVELMVSPLNPSLSLIAQDAMAQETTTTCATGQTYDSTLNRCLTKDETAQVMNATASCPVGDKECYKANAESAFSKKVASGEAPENVGKNGMGQIGQVFGVAGAVTYAILGFSQTKSSCASSSFWGMVAGGAAAFIGDQLANMQHRKRLKQIKEDWGKIVNPEEAAGDKDKERTISIEAQSEAFEMMARAEESLAKAAKMKKNFFMIATIAYGVTAAISAYELIMVNNPWTAAASRAAFTCPVTASNYGPKKESLYSYYSKPQGPSVKEQLQLEYNLKNSQDMTSLVLNTEALQGRNVGINEHEALKDSLVVDKDSFETFKDVVVTFVSNINPLGNAVAQTTTTTDTSTTTPPSTTTSTSTSTSATTTSTPATTTSTPATTSTTSSSQGVNTNAAMAYKDDGGKGFDFMPLAIGAVAGFAAAKMLAGPLMSPEGRLAFSGVMALMTMQMATHAGKQAEAAEKRAALLRQMKEEFNVASGAVYACKSEDRNDPAKPNCYCYTAENARNTSRTSSTVCQQLWAGVNTTPTNYNAQTNTAKVCISNTGQTDTSCACKSTNTCMKVGVTGLTGLNPGTMSMLSSGLAPVNGIANGTLDGANVNAGSLANTAAKIDQLNKQLQKQPAVQNIAKKNNKLKSDLTNKLMKGGASLNAGSRLGASGSSGFGMPSNPGEAARMLEKELKTEEPTGVGKSEVVAAGGDGGAKNEQLEFGLSQDDLAAQEGQLAEVMKQDLDYGGNEMNPDAKANIFEVLSNRYQKSGMKRLFEDAPVPAPKAPAAAASADPIKK